MCGIAGIVGAGDINQMLRTIAHRGPDGKGAYVDGEIKLGACCLKITDPAAGNQPFFSEDRSVRVLLNGEIYNYLEIKKGLKGHRFKTETDTEVIVHAYEEYGIECLNKFNGCFAIAIYDGKHLFLARDRVGEKPLYYYHKGNRFIFSSEIKALLTQIRAVPNITENFKVFETVLDEETLFKGIFSLLPGSVLTFDGREVKIKKYWQLNSHQGECQPEHKYIDRLRWLIEDAVRLRQGGNVSCGLFLSGGIDSSLIAYLAKPRHVFFCHYASDAHFNELPYARFVAQDIKAKLHLIRPQANDLKKYYKKIVWHLDQPIATASTLSAFLLAKKASEYVRVVLNGEGSDELFGGYVRYLLMLIENKLSKAPELRYYHSLARFFWNEQLFTDPVERYFSLTKRGIPQTTKPFAKIKEIFSRHHRLIDKICAADIEITLPSLLMMGDRACSAFGLENRSPFLDYRIIEFAFSLPEDMKIRDLQTKYILRKAARGIVPDKIINRKYKKGLTTPITRWFSNDLSGWVKILSKRFRQRGINFSSGEARGQYDRYLYMLISMELWFQIFIDKKK